ncbi:MAG: SDR family NAD(P)-dependent oxidoreductase [Myxococcales bacterium]|nr:SDR family NAD(P)-dependent oxidoreductase [Myxococcales bacterium]USN51804.1 MAG: SDR family NAD(P)-dependent oxidoreductase [Myxococcales bacterium]
MNKFKDQLAWITGASSGIGAALARELAREGAIVALSARRIDRLNELKNEIGEQAYIYPLDVQNKEDVEKTVQEIIKDHGKLDVVIANAGYGVVSPFEKISESMWRKQFDTNVFGVIWTLQAAIPYLKESKGRAAIMTSVAGKLAIAHTAAYSSSKYALIGIANALYQELAPYGISVTNIAPGFIESEIFKVDNWGHLDPSKSKASRSLLRWPSNKAAKVMLRAIHERKREAVITGHGKVAAFLGTHLAPLTYWGLSKIGVKGSH